VVKRTVHICPLPWDPAAAVTVRLLGEIPVLRGTPSTDAAVPALKGSQAGQLACYLATHGGRAPLREWRRLATRDGVKEASVALGGRLVVGGDGTAELVDCTSDWGAFQASVAAGDLVGALALIEGRPFGDVPLALWPWVSAGDVDLVEADGFGRQSGRVGRRRDRHQY
jgi:hypothetical protein